MYIVAKDELKQTKVVKLRVLFMFKGDMFKKFIWVAKDAWHIFFPKKKMAEFRVFVWAP